MSQQENATKPQIKIGDKVRVPEKLSHKIAQLIERTGFHASFFTDGKLKVYKVLDKNQIKIEHPDNLTAKPVVHMKFFEPVPA